MNWKIFLLPAIGASALTLHVLAQPGHSDTPMQPNGKWRIHDDKRPPPATVTPPGSTAPPTPAAPSDAIVLLGPTTGLAKNWKHHDGSDPKWKVKQGVAEVSGGAIRTRDEFGDVQLHLEWAAPEQVSGSGQGRGNSGVFFAGSFEVQILDSYQNHTYPDGQAAALYGQYPPLVNASRPPGQWQVYDIVFLAPVFDKKTGKLCKPAKMTVFHNGVLVHHNAALPGTTQHRAVGAYKPELARGPIVLQDHGNPVRFRNIWVRPLKYYDE